MFSFYYILALCLFSFSVDADIVCPANPPSATSCADCQNAINSVLPANFSQEPDPHNLPATVHPCDVYELWFVELLRHWTPNKTAFDPDVPQLVKDSIATACTLSEKCTAEFALPEAKTVENKCGDLVAASGNDTGGINDALLADQILYGGVPQRQVYCTKDNNGESFGFQILVSILDDAKTKRTPDQIYIHAPNHPILGYYLVSKTHQATPEQMPVSAMCTPAYAFMVNTYTAFVANNPPDSRFTYITDNLKTAVDTLQSNCPDLLNPPNKVKREKLGRFSRKRM